MPYRRLLHIQFAKRRLLFNDYSLYSTATQNHSRWVLLRHPTQNPNASQWNIGCVGSQTQNFRVGHVHFMFFVLISFAFGTQRESVEYRLRWVPNAKFSRWPCIFHVFCVDFICIWDPTQTQFPVKYGLKSI